MTYSVLLLGASGLIGSKIAKELFIHKDSLKRVAFLTPRSSAEREAKYAEVPLERVNGTLEDKRSYEGFDIVISAVGDAVCQNQPKYFDAAIAGGVKHFYPAEYGADLNRDGTFQERYFKDKIAARRHVEMRSSEDPSIGYTLIMTRIFSDFFIHHNVLGLSVDKHSATYTGAADSRLSTTHSNDVARIIVTSLLPAHLKTLNEKRRIEFAGTTMSFRDIFGTVEKVLGHNIDVTYISKEENLTKEKEYLADGNMFMYTFSSAARSMGFGGSELDALSNGLYPEIKAQPWRIRSKLCWWISNLNFEGENLSYLQARISNNHKLR